MKLTKQERNNLLARAVNKAKEKGGECLSTEYKNAREKMEWTCSNPEHSSWTATYQNVVLQGTWCPHCKADHATRHQKAHQVAQSKGGKCLSAQYTGAAAKHRFECAEGHQWESRYSSVVNDGHWCPQCKHANHYKKFENKKNKGDKK